MGPQPNGCGKDKHRRLLRGASVASMGPQPNGCGKVCALRGQYEPGGLQWGRSRMAAESDERVRQAEVTVSASMGPQPNGCGKWDNARLMRESLLALQWGRSRMAAERDGVEPQRHPPVAASMGPQPNGCGKLPSC